MNIDQDLLYRFEKGLDPQNLSGSEVPAAIIGYGEMSAIFWIGGNDEVAYKRMPLFPSLEEAETYSRMYGEYCRQLAAAGLALPEDDTIIIDVPGRPVVLYIAQEMLPADRLCHKLIHTQSPEASEKMIARVVTEIEKIWAFNNRHGPSLKIAVDGQLSNWVYMPEGADPDLLYIDTSTPLFTIDGMEQLNPELILQSAPGFLRWIVRLFFLEDVMTRYYVPRLVYTDLAGNLFKEQRPDLVPNAVATINRHFKDEAGGLTEKEVEKYYREDKLIWRLWLAFRRVDRFLTTRVRRKRYEFILPGKIKR